MSLSALQRWRIAVVKRQALRSAKRTTAYFRKIERAGRRDKRRELRKKIANKYVELMEAQKDIQQHEIAITKIVRDNWEVFE